MNKKSFSKLRNFLKKEGFYVSLLVCLCVIATVTAVTSKYSKKVVPQTPIAEKAQNNENKVAELPKEQMNNALEVKRTTKVANKSQSTKKIAKKVNKSTAVSKNINMKFIKPVEGKVVREYSEVPVYWQSTNSSRPHWGIDIKCEKGKPVVAVMEGEIESVEDSQDGKTITILHKSNGLRSIYSNLNPNVFVKKGQKVKQGFVIAKAGETTIRESFEKYGKNFLHFAITKNKNEYVNPLKYVKY